jgi:dTDP-4-dehydrorhamnose reductase
MIWVIGSNGMLGREICNFFEKTKFKFISSDIDVDISVYENLLKFIGNMKIDWIVNCAAYTAVDKAEDETDLAFKINSLGAENIAKFANEIGAKLIHISTDYVFSGDKETEYLETDLPDPTGAYGKSKLSGEDKIINILKNYFIIRISWLIGFYGHNFFFTMLKLFNDRNEIRVVNDQYGSPTFSKLVAVVISEMINQDFDKYGIYHLSCENKTTWYDFTNKIYELLKYYRIINKDITIIPIKTSEYPTKAVRPKNSYLSKEKIKAKLNIELPNWEDGLEEFIINHFANRK